MLRELSVQLSVNIEKTDAAMIFWWWTTTVENDMVIDQIKKKPAFFSSYLKESRQIAAIYFTYLIINTFSIIYFLNFEQIDFKLNKKSFKK